MGEKESDLETFDLLKENEVFLTFNVRQKDTKTISLR